MRPLFFYVLMIGVLGIGHFPTLAGVVPKSKNTQPLQPFPNHQKVNMATPKERIIKAPAVILEKTHPVSNTKLNPEVVIYKTGKREQVRQEQTGAFGVVSFVSALAGVVTLFFSPISILLLLGSVVFGVIGLSKKRRLRGLALTGLLISSILLLFGALVILLIIIAFA